MIGRLEIRKRRKNYSPEDNLKIVHRSWWFLDDRGERPDCKS
jgi:hypothetical protein